MSKTSARQARKRKLDYQRGRLANQYVVSYEKHMKAVSSLETHNIRLSEELERVSAVLADLIEEQKGAAVPAREVVSWVKNPEMTHYLLGWSGRDLDGYCGSCDSTSNQAHDYGCKVFAAWWRLGLEQAQHAIEVAHAAAIRENQLRASKAQTMARRAVRITGLFDGGMPGVRGLRNRSVAINAADVNRIPHDEAAHMAFDGIQVVVSELVRPGEAYLLPEPIPGEAFPIEYPMVSTPRASRDWRGFNYGGPPRDFRREYLGEFPPLETRIQTQPEEPDEE